MSNPGDLDTTFSDDGFQSINTGGNGVKIAQILFEPNTNGNIIVLANNSTTYAAHLLRYNSAGTLNNYTPLANFGIPINQTVANTMSIYTTNAEIIIVANAKSGTPPTVERTVIFRRRLDLDLSANYANPSFIPQADLSFSLITFTKINITSSVIVGNKLICGGSCGSVARSNFTLTRRNIPSSSVNTTIDNSFGTNGVTSTDFGGQSIIQDIKLDSAGNIFAAGSANIGGFSYFALAKYNSSGILDTTNFANSGKPITSFDNHNNAYAYSMEIDSNNRIVLVGKAVTNLGRESIALARYNSNGTLDSTFGTNGKVITTLTGSCSAQTVKIDSNGLIIVAGYIQNANKDLLILRYKTNGQLDNTFKTVGYLSTPIINEVDSEFNSLILDSSNNIIVGGYTYFASRNFGVLIKYIGGIYKNATSVFSNFSMKPAFTDNSRVFYKPHSGSSCGGGGTVKNARIKSYKT